MQLYQNSKIEMVRVLLNLDSQIRPGSSSPFQYFAELSRPFISIPKGICFERFVWLDGTLQ